MRNTRRFFPAPAAVALALTTWACSGSQDVVTAPPVPTAPAVPVVAADPTARYRVTFDATWSASTHPDVPPSPHFSGLIGGTHRAAVSFWAAGAPASEGIRTMAERGRKSPLDEEVQAAIQAGHAQYILSGDAVNATPGRAELEFDISRDFPLVTLVTMVAPSPDWFVGVAGESLLEGGDWTRERVVPLYAYDAGTDSGETFEARDAPTQPREAVARIAGAPFRAGTGTPPLGTFTFRRVR